MEDEIDLMVWREFELEPVVLKMYLLQVEYLKQTTRLRQDHGLDVDLVAVGSGEHTGLDFLAIGASLEKNNLKRHPSGKPEQVVGVA